MKENACDALLFFKITKNMPNYSEISPKIDK